MKRFFLGLLLIVSLFSQIFVGCVPQESAQTHPAEPLPQTDVPYGIRVAVLYDAGMDSVSYEDTLAYLDQAVILGLESEQVDISKSYDLSGYDLVLADEAVAASAFASDLEESLARFARDGGYVLLDNEFSQIFSGEFLGISGTRKLEACPLDLIFPNVGEDLGAVQEIIADFAALYPEYYEAETLLSRDYGWGFVADGAQVLASLEDLAVYTAHDYGQGCVLLTNDLLPNVYSLGNLSMTHREEGQTAFAHTTASCNQLFYSRVAALAAKDKFGYALNRVYGTYASPSMAWELHYEEITAFENNAMEIFDDLCRDYLQIPSYTIIRNTYWWFLRTETVTYLLNEALNGHQFSMDFEESAYSSGTHIAADGQWLHQNSIENAGSYFREYPEYDYRAYPIFADVDGDGETELVSGSADGTFYVYDDLTYTERLHTTAGIQLTDEAGQPLSVSGYSAPQMVDCNGDGILDLLSGSDSGDIWLFAGRGDGAYEPAQLLLTTDISGQVMPSVGDLNGDGLADLVVGSNQGILLVFYGQQQGWSYEKMDSLTKICANAKLGSFLAPCVVDWDADGVMDILIGTFDGYLAILTGGDYQHTGFVDLDEKNYKGNNHVKFGNCAVPCFYDVDGDGREDLVCGSLEYGLAYPIDSPYFPYREQLQAQFDYAAEHYQYVGVHHYTNGFASAKREAYELQRHKEAFAAYGLDMEGLGANLHTWYSSVLGDTQTFDSQWEAGLLWNSGFSSPGDPGVAPQYAAENVICLPFFLQKDGADTMLLQNNSVLPYAGELWTDISGKYHMPMCVYYHCDFVYLDDTGARDYAQKLSDFQWKFGYNFMREDQLMRASAAARNLFVGAAYENGGLSLYGYGLEEDPFFDALGVEISFGENHDAASFATDAKVWHREGNSLFVSLDNGVKIVPAGESSSFLRQVNLPADITVSETGASVVFTENGMMQVVAEGEWICAPDCTGWTVTAQNGQTVFTKYGSAQTLQIQKP